MPGGGRRAQYKHPETKVWLDNMAEKGWTVPTWPVKYGGAGLDKEQNAGAAGRAAPHQRAAGAVRHGHQHDRPGAARVRHRRTESRASAEDRARADLVVSGLQRTERRLRPREPEDERGRKRRRVHHQRLEDLDVRRRSRRLDLLPGAHRPESAEARRHHVHPVRHRSTGRHRQTDPADQRHVAVLRNVLRQRARAEEERGRRSEQGLDRREAAAAVRTHVDRRHRRRHATGGEARRHREGVSRRERRSHRRRRYAATRHRAPDERPQFRSDDATFDGRVAVRSRARRCVVDVQVLRHRTEHPQVRTAAVDHGYPGDRLGRRQLSRRTN